MHEGIWFNGVQDDGHEGFRLSRQDHGPFCFCNINRKPYDIVVTCVLLRLRMVAADDFCVR